MKEAARKSQTIATIVPSRGGETILAAERALVRLLARQAASEYVAALRDRAGDG